MSLLSYGVLILVVVLGGLVLLVIFSLLAMAQQGDSYLDQQEFNLPQQQDCPPASVEEAKSPNLSGLAKQDLKLV
ncbi:MAG: hypothetical protein WBV23_11685 [Desulfobaccales bacterium]